MIFDSGLNYADYIVMALLGFGLLLSMLRFWVGPYAPDRIVAADTLSVIVTAGLVLVAFWFDSSLYLDVALVYGVLAFVGVVALARTIERGSQ